MRQKLLGLIIISLVGAVGCPSRGGAATIDERASILFFPRVIADGVSDTMIEISNSSYMPAYAYCTYINAVPGGGGPAWDDTDFYIEMHPDQPTHWVVSRGRENSPGDPVCGSTFLEDFPDFVPLSDCDGAGFDPGYVPPAPEGFVGSIMCVQVDGMHAPWSGNSLLGTATVTDGVSYEVAKYNAVGLRGFDSNDGDARLCAGGEARDGCPRGAEYDTCPRSWNLLHRSDSSLGDETELQTSVTLVPCYTNLALEAPTDLDLDLVLTSEFEQQFSIRTSVQCFADVALFDLNPAFGRDVLGGEVLRTTITATNDEGFLVVGRTRQGNGSGSERVTAAAGVAHRNVDIPDPEGIIRLRETGVR